MFYSYSFECECLLELPHFMVLVPTIYVLNKNMYQTLFALLKLGIDAQLMNCLEKENTTMYQHIQCRSNYGTNQLPQRS